MKCRNEKQLVTEPPAKHLAHLFTESPLKLFHSNPTKITVAGLKATGVFELV